MSWTVAQDVLDAWIGLGAPEDLASVTTWLGRAERLVRSEVPGLQARIDGGLEPDLLEDVRDVVVSMVERKFRNPEGVRTRQETTGPFSGSVTLGGDQPGELWITDAELKRLRAPGGTTGGAFTVDTIPVTSPMSPHYVPPAGVWW
ncbi:hypothetical protein D6T65_05000 [Arthrobacter frigidicola]|nr:hypothetical protein D6T65_05000 [Arthrobacter frigidicola]